MNVDKIIINGDELVATIYERQNGNEVVIFNTSVIDFEKGLKIYDTTGNIINDKELEDIIIDFIIPMYGYRNIQ